MKKNRTAIILAGGKSKRMGEDKALMLFKGKSFVQYVVEVVTPYVDDILIISDKNEHDVFGIKRIEDLIKNSGPLGGIYTGLINSKTEDNLILSCDVPNISSNLIDLLLNQNEEDREVIQFESKGNSMPLIAIYKKKCAPACLKALNSNQYQLRALVNSLKTKTLILEEELEKYVVNINTPTELKQLENGDND